MRLKTVESDATASARADIRRLHRAAEPEVLKPLLKDAALDADSRQRVERRALGMLAELRAAQSSGWVNQFLQEYRLNTSEGIALLSLAEAFLRVPDPETADALIADKLGNADWRAHKGKSASSLVNSATWGLVIGRALVSDSEQASALKRLIGRVGEPFVRQAVGAAMKLMGEIFVMGRTIDEALRRMEKRENAGFTASFDMLGEAARTFPDAERYFTAYEEAIRAVGKVADRGHSISVKLSALHPRYEVAQYERCVPSLIGQVEALGGAGQIGGDRLHHRRRGERAARDEPRHHRGGGGPALAQGLGRARHGGPGLWQALPAGARLGRRARRRDRAADRGAAGQGRLLGQRDQADPGAGAIRLPALHPQGGDRRLLPRLRARHAGGEAHLPRFATHNALTVATILEWAGGSRDFEFQRLHGMGEGLYEPLVREQGYHTRIYAPVGGHRDLLAYLVRRLLENGANSSFVHQLADERLSDADLIADPVARIAAVGGHPPPGDPAALATCSRRTVGTARASTSTTGPSSSGSRRRWRRRSTSPPPTSPAAGQLVTRALEGFDDWSKRERRGARLGARAARRPARAGARHADADRVQEARKTMPDALAEVREAVDFCRYYAAQARQRLQPVELPGPTGERNVLRMEGRGAWVCIAPWNFPLAIFLGQVSAALVAGNSVIAKPASQTPQIAAYAVGLAHEAGIPEDALILAAGRPRHGPEIDGGRRIAGVAFTGSTATAKTIARTLIADDHRDIIPLIAETGGVNAMIVDSTALPEQVVLDVVTSAFRSAGQRCSALRLLVLQEDVAERTLEMLAGAMDTLIVGDPADPRTDVGPVIDKPSFDKLMGRREAMKDRIVKTVAAPAEGLFVPPTLIRIDAIEDLREEWFGPLLHVTTWKGGRPRRDGRRVNSSGFGLTMGLHSRIARAAETVEETGTVGNLYVNRSMIGAIVGSQPFGGEGLSGTGPKAGGPHYLPRFCAERVTSTDTTSAGGNATLLSLEDVGL
jgi:RHH-type proline utilization regulon transcriptional repressor/proline dehydrogenase/delta 1-pyrroline-5-carboxylate dehydrogenase